MSSPADAGDDDDDFGFEICNVILARSEDRGPLQMISGERLARLLSIESAAVRVAVNPSPDNVGLLVALIRQKPPVERSDESIGQRQN